MSGQPWRVLIADDDPTAALLFRAALAGGEFELVLADNGIDALAYFREQSFDLVLLDVEMPGMDGLAVCRAIRQLRGLSFPVVLATGRNDPAFLMQVDALSARHLGKPINWSRLPLVLRAYLMPGTS
jgi:CheY-like chemotaxis protein